MSIIKRKILPFIAVVTIMTLVGAGCSSKPSKTTNDTIPTTNSVRITNLSFSPARIIVNVGTTVTWTNNDSTTHTVTGNKDGPSSGSLAPGTRYSFTFKSPGKYPYHCTIHADMIGSMMVIPTHVQ